MKQITPDIGAVRVNLRAFTLIEMLVVIAIISILAILAIAGYSSALERARRAVCTTNLEQIGVAAIAFASDHKGWLPPGSAGNYPYHAGYTYPLSERGDPSIGLGGLIPYLGGSSTSDTSKIHIFYCPSSAIPQSQWGDTSYMQYCGWLVVGEPYYPNSPSTIRDHGILWSDFTRRVYNDSNHMGGGTNIAGANAVYVDGHVEWTPGSQLTNEVDLGFKYLFPSPY